MSKKITLRGNDSHTETSTVSPLSTVENGIAPAYRFDINLFDLARMIFARRRLIVSATLAVMICATIYLFLQPNLFTSTATILPSGKSSGMSALKSLIGMGTPITEVDDNSSALYPLILQSNLIVDAVLAREYTFTDRGRSHTTNLKDHFGIDNHDRLRHALRDITTIRADYQTGEIALGVQTQYPPLSQQILTAYLAELEEFNRYKRRSTARENEQYLKEQMATLNADLQQAEDHLESFQQANLDWAFSGSPEILKELGRLQREVDSKSAAYTMLAQQYEMAKLETQKEIPIVRILDAPSLPTVKSGPFRRNIILITGCVTCMLVVLIVIIRHLILQITDSDQTGDYDALRDEIRTAFPRTRHVVNRMKTTILEKTPVLHK